MVNIHQQGATCPRGEGSGRVKRKDDRWKGYWKIQSTLMNSSSFPQCQQQRDQTSSYEMKGGGLYIFWYLELTLPWEFNLDLAEERKEIWYENLLEQWEEQGWTATHSHLGVGARGYVDKKLHHLFRIEMGFSPTEVKQFRGISEAAQRKLKRLLFSYGWRGTITPYSRTAAWLPEKDNNMGVYSGLWSTYRSQNPVGTSSRGRRRVGWLASALSVRWLKSRNSLQASRFISDVFQAAGSRCKAAARNALTGRCLLTSFFLNICYMTFEYTM